jgi:hypothetical protein
MTDRHIRFAIAIVTIGIVAASFGAAAEGKRPDTLSTATETRPLILSDAEVRWCSNGANVALILESAEAEGLLDGTDSPWLWMTSLAAREPATDAQRRRVGNMYAGLRNRWEPWDEVCRSANTHAR